MKLKTIGARFDTSTYAKTYNFLADIELTVGDKVVVETQHGLSVATVVEVHERIKQASKFVVQKVDTEAHAKRVERESKRRELKEKMEARRKQLEEVNIYRILAKEDEEIAALLSEYEGMSL